VPIAAIPSPSYNNNATKEQIDAAWKECLPSDGGTVYYYNTLSGTTQWDMPDALKRPTTASSSTPPTSSMTLWKEYTDVASGKKYYSNGITTTWNPPSDLVGIAKTDERNTAEPPKKKVKTETVPPNLVLNNKEEAVMLFKGLLLAKEITPAMKWNDVVKLCSSSDALWDACAVALSVGERKQSMAEFQSKRANELRDMERQEKVRIKERFLQLLTDVVPTIPSFSAWTTRLDTIRDKLTSDDRFHAVDSERNRENLYLDFCVEFKKREERKKQNARREAKVAFQGFLNDKGEVGVLSFASTWASFFASLNADDMVDCRFATSAVMTDADRQVYFADYVMELQVLEDDNRRRAREVKRQAEKAERFEYLENLRELAADGKIVPSARWRNVENVIVDLPSYMCVYEQDQEAPRELFEEFVGEWNENYRRDRSILSELVFPKTNKQLIITEETLYEEFTNALLEVAKSVPELCNEARRIVNQSDPVSASYLYFRELVLHLKGSKGSARHEIQRSDTLQAEALSSEDEGEIIEDE
jgi:pre-mRNA-processing factor 40